MRIGQKYIKHTDGAPTYEAHIDIGCKWWHGDGRQCLNCPYPACINDFCNDDDSDFKAWVKGYRKELMMAIAIGG